LRQCLSARKSYSFLGAVVLARALNPNQVNQQVVPLAYAFNDPGLQPPGNGTNTLSGSLNYNVNSPYGSPLTPVGPNPVPSGGGIPTLDFSTANGRITSFSMTFGGSFPYGHETLTLSSAGDSYYASVADPGCECGGYWSGSNKVSGTWTRAPEINPGVAATALTLLCGFALLLNGKRRS
jgi:hypothetical protein